MKTFPLLKHGKTYFVFGLCFLVAFTIMGLTGIVYCSFFYTNEARTQMIVCSILWTILGLSLCGYVWIKERKELYTTIGISSDGIHILQKNNEGEILCWSDIHDCGICSIYRVGYFSTFHYIFFSRKMLTEREKLYMVTTANHGKICLNMSEDILCEIKKFFPHELKKEYYTRKR